MPDPIQPTLSPLRLTASDLRPVRPSTSALAVLSLILGVFSPPFICLCWASLGTSLAAIITGHVARGRIRRSAGALTGGALALGGLILGYIVFVGTATLLVCSLVLFRTKPTSSPAPTITSARPRSAAAALDAVERKIVSDSSGIAFGNTEQAKALAEKYAQAMEDVDEAFFTQTDAHIKLTGGHYVTWCELREDRCALVVHVPEYRRFDNDAKKLLSKLAWQTAQEVTRGTLPEGSRLAVGLKGVLLYGAVMTGRVAAEDAEDSGPDMEDTDKTRLVPFFESSDQDEPERAPVETPTTPAVPEPDASPQPAVPDLSKDSGDSQD